MGDVFYAVLLSNFEHNLLSFSLLIYLMQGLAILIFTIFDALKIVVCFCQELSHILLFKKISRIVTKQQVSKCFTPTFSNHLTVLCMCWTKEWLIMWSPNIIIPTCRWTPKIILECLMVLGFFLTNFIKLLLYPLEIYWVSLIEMFWKGFRGKIAKILVDLYLGMYMLGS